VSQLVLTAVVAEVGAVAVAGGDDDGGDGGLEAAEAAVARPEKLALQRPSCRHLTGSLRRVKGFSSYSNEYHSFVPADVQKNTASFVSRLRGNIRLARKIYRE
jgi:hypothetical protein